MHRRSTVLHQKAVEANVPRQQRQQHRNREKARSSSRRLRKMPFCCLTTTDITVINLEPSANWKLGAIRAGKASDYGRIYAADEADVVRSNCTRLFDFALVRGKLNMRLHRVRMHISAYEGKTNKFCTYEMRVCVYIVRFMHLTRCTGHR